MKKKLTRAQKDRRNARARQRREEKSKIVYKEKIETINLILNDYFNYFGDSGYEYDNVANTIEKIFMNKFDFVLNNGTSSKPTSITTLAANIQKDRRNLRSTITRAFKYIQSLEHASVVAQDVYGMTDKKVTKIASALRKLENDISPNYYNSLSVLSSDEQMEFKKMFSDQLKGKKRSSKDYAKEYEDIGNKIMKYLEQKQKMEKELLDDLEKDRVGEPTTLGEIISKLKK